jgi:hypothetical protein
VNAARIAEKLGGRKSGRGYVARCPAHEDTSPSLSLRDGDRGIMVHCFAGCSAADIYAAIRRFDADLLPRGGVVRPEPGKVSAEYERQQHEKAGWLWRQRKPIIGSIAEKYLRRGRGISCALPRTLGFLPPRKPGQHPAMIAAFGLCAEPEPDLLAAPAVLDANAAVHLTLLKPDGSGKAETKPDKLTIGSPRGRPVVLAPPNDLLGLAISEGIEDGLSVYQATGLGVWAAGSAPFLPKIAALVPSYIEVVTVIADADPVGQRKANELLDELRQRGIEASKITLAEVPHA